MFSLLNKASIGGHLECDSSQPITYLHMPSILAVDPSTAPMRYLIVTWWMGELNMEIHCGNFSNHLHSIRLRY